MLNSVKPVIDIQLDAIEGVKLPSMATEGSAGYDLCSAIEIEIPAGEYVKVPTGLRIAMPQGLEAQVRPRSGLAAKHGVTVLNSPGTIDSDYRGEICILLINHGKKSFMIEPGMRVAQLIFSKVIQVEFHEKNSLEDSDRGTGGFGSTGTK